MKIRDVWKETLRKIDVDKAFNIAEWAEEHLAVKLYSNQVEIVNAVADPSVRYLVIIQSRSGGKTFSTAVGLICLSLAYPRVSVGVFAPKWDQAIRVVREAQGILKQSPEFSSVDWTSTSQSRLVFKNGSIWLAMSANEYTMSEGFHFDVLCCDESQRITDLAMNQKLSPMIASSWLGKIIKLGVPLYKNHFYRSYISGNYKCLVRSWEECPILLRGGVVEIDGKKYSRYVLERMPLSLKQRYFPNHPELWVDGDVNEIDFITQYEVRWVDDINLVLSEEDQSLLLSGTHETLEEGRNNETYVFGLDTAVGTPLPNSTSLDFTALSIFRVVNDVKELVFCKEWQGHALDQLTDVTEIVTRKFKCIRGCVDFSGAGAIFVEHLRRAGVDTEGIVFGASCKEFGGKNFKNAMLDLFLAELKAGRVKYPRREFIKEGTVFKKHLDQWFALERRRTKTLNDKIEVPEREGHDDGVMSNLLAVWASRELCETTRPRVTSSRVYIPGFDLDVKIYGGGFSYGY